MTSRAKPFAASVCAWSALAIASARRFADAAVEQRGGARAVAQLDVVDHRQQRVDERAGADRVFEGERSRLAGADDDDRAPFVRERIGGGHPVHQRGGAHRGGARHGAQSARAVRRRHHERLAADDVAARTTPVSCRGRTLRSPSHRARRTAAHRCGPGAARAPRRRWASAPGSRRRRRARARSRSSSSPAGRRRPRRACRARPRPATAGRAGRRASASSRPGTPPGRRAPALRPVIGF